jgi:hypothetical protein
MTSIEQIKPQKVIPEEKNAKTPLKSHAPLMGITII